VNDAAPRAFKLVIAAAVVIKLLYLAEYVELPFLYGPLFDSMVYLHQARAVRAGDFADPALLAFSPLYGYFLWALGARLGGVLPVLVQLGLGLVNLALIRHVAARLFADAWTGVVAAALYLGYGLLVFYEMKIMSETLGMTLLLGALALFVSPRFRDARAHTGVAVGSVLGLATLARASLLTSLPLFACAALLPLSTRDDLDQTPTASRVRRMGFLALGLALVLGANGLWNLGHAGVFVPVIMVSKTAAQATSGEWTGDFSVFRKEGQYGVSAWSVVEQAREELARRAAGKAPRDPGPGIDWAGWLRQAPNKTLMTLRDTETSFDYGYYGERTEVHALVLTSISFGALLSLAVLGVFVCARQGSLPVLLPLVPIIAGVLATTTLFHPSSRYRLPLAVALIPVAAYALATLWRAEVSREQRLVLRGALVILVAYFASSTIGYELRSPGMWQLRMAEAEIAAGDPKAAKRRIQRAIVEEPNDRGVRERAAYLIKTLPPER
jgi:hypothetical protein